MALGILKNKKKQCKIAMFFFAVMLYTHLIGNQLNNTMMMLKMCDGVLVPVLVSVMYCVYGEYRSSLLTECTDSMIPPYNTHYPHLYILTTQIDSTY